MRNLKVPRQESLEERSKTILNGINTDFEKVPNVYKQLGYSAPVLESFLDYSKTFNNLSFEKKQVEAIKLLTSELNNCKYCVAAHTELGKQAGWTQEQLWDIRSRNTENPELKSLLNMTYEVVKNQGYVDQPTIDQFYNNGFTEKHMVELVGIISETTMTNYLNRMFNTPIDFPEVKALSEVQYA